MVYCVGLTGNIASGKTTVTNLFADLGIEIINADKISKELSLKNNPAYKAIVTHFGETIVGTDGELNRRQLRSIIFSDPEERAWLEQLLHPLIRQKISQQASSCTGPYCIVEIPLLLNKEQYPYLNKILLVTAPIETQISRVIARDQCTREEALAVISNQPSLELRMQSADDVIINKDGIEELHQLVKNLHAKYLQDAAALP